MRKLAMFAAACFLGSAAASYAQTPSSAPATQFFVLDDLQVRPDAHAAFEAAAKKWCAALVKGGAASCNVYETPFLGDLNRYVIVSPVKNFAHWDGPLFLPAETLKALRAEMEKTVTSIQQSVIVRYGNLGLQSGKPSDLIQVTEIQLHPGMLQSFFDDVEKFELPAAKKANLADFWVYKTVQGNSPDRCFLVVPIANYAYYDQPNPLLPKMSTEDRAAFMQHSSMYSEKVTYSTMHLRRDLSTAPVQPAT